VRAVQEVTGAAPGQDDLQGALVSVQPGTGEVWAYYGGATGTGFDFARNGGAGRQPGSTFKPYVLATALSQGMSLRTRLDGDDDKSFPGIPAPISNFGGRSYGSVDLVEATQRSVNTAFFELGLEVGPAEVAKTAHAAGIPRETPLANPDGTVEGGISLGSYEVQVLDQAVGFATFANKGVPVRPYLVREVRRGDEVLYRAEVETGPAAFSEEVAADATWAMQQVVRQGTGRSARLSGGRDVAGKTGTSSDNRDAWFVGFTPQLSTAVWLGYADPRTIRLDGVEVTGGGFSSRIFKDFMDLVHEGLPEAELPEPVFGGERARFSDGGGDDDDDQVSSPRPRRSSARQSDAPEPTVPAEPSSVPSEPSEAPAPTPAPVEPSAEPPGVAPPVEEPEPADPAASPAALVGPGPGG
jgi:membrane peptidoglycan carboxypeptidase